MTWKLWHALSRPSTIHPLYTWALARRRAAFRQRQLHLPSSRWLHGTAKVALSLVTLVLALPALLLFIYALFIIAPFAVPIAYNTFSALYATSISSMIAEEREQRRYDILCVCPLGTLGMNWSLSAAWLQHSTLYDRVYGATVYLSCCVGAIGAAGVLLFLLEPSREGVVGVWLLCAAGTFFVDFVQTVISAALIGMIVPLYAENQPNARMWAIGLLLGMQTLGYAAALAMGLVVAPALFTLLGLRGLLIDCILPFITIGTLLALREGLILMLAWHLQERTIADFEDVSSLSLITHWKFSR
jgi:hypothetical protein